MGSGPSGGWTGWVSVGVTRNLSRSRGSEVRDEAFGMRSQLCPLLPGACGEATRLSEPQFTQLQNGYVLDLSSSEAFAFNPHNALGDGAVDLT